MGYDRNGSKNPMYGKHHSNKTLLKMREKAKERLKDPNRLKTLIEAGVKGAARAKETQTGNKKSDLHKQHLSEAAIKRCSDPGWRQQASENATRRQSDPLVRKRIGDVSREHFKDPDFKEKHRKSCIGRNDGEKSHLWKGGISFEPYCPAFNNVFKERVRAFFGYICQECLTPQNGEKLHVHHVNFNKMSCCDTTKPLFIPLCRSCHSATNHNRDYWEQHFTDMIDGFFQGKCYLSIDEMSALGY